MMSNRQILILFFFCFALGLSAQNKNVSVISLEKVNVVYRGITNPVKIAVPGAKSFVAKAEGTFEKIDSIGNYNWNVTGVSGTKGLIKIDAVMPDNTIIHEKKEFEIKAISWPIGFINSHYNFRTYEMTYDQIKSLSVKTIIENLNFSVDTTYYKVESFTISISGEETIVVRGNKINNKVFNLLKKLPIGTEFFIDNIQTYNPEQYSLGRLNSIKIRIVHDDKKLCNPIVLSNFNNTIIYRGIDNPLKIEVPSAKSFTVKAQGLSEMAQDSTFTINVNKVKENKVFVDFTIVTSQDSIIHTQETLYIKDITPKKITINDKSCKGCVLKMTLQELKNAIIDIKVDDLEESWSNIIVSGFILKLPKGKKLEVDGDRITDNVLNEISKLNKNSLIELTTPYYGAEGFTHDPPPLKIVIVDK